MPFLPSQWGSSMGLILLLVSGVIMSLMSKNMFVVWVGLELKMFGVIPLLNSKSETDKSVLLTSKKEINVSFFYFFVQVIGSLFFAWGSILGKWYIISIMGLIMKMGAAPFFWWVPALISRLDWFSMGLLSTMQKMPGVMLFRLIFDLSLDMCMFLSLLGFFMASMGLNNSYKNMKKLMAWSSVSKMSMLFLLMVLNNKLGLVYYLFYSVLVLMFCTVLSFSKFSMICGTFLSGKKSNSSGIIGCLLMILSGLPPFMSFLLKLYFLGGFYLFDSANMIMDLELKGKEVSFFHLLGSFLNSWKVVFIYILLMMLQSMGYMKAFIKIKSTSSSRLLKSSFLLNSKDWLFFMLFGIIYISSLLIVWL